jgi:branched-chain amino acid transport system substrate-binding protein
MKAGRLVAIGASAAMLMAASACGSGGAADSTSGGTVKIGISTSLSGSIANLGQTGLQGLKLAVKHINEDGGVLGKKVSIVSADDNVTPATGAANVRSMVTRDHVVALFGPVASSIASAEEQVADQYKVPIFFHTSNDASLMTKTFSKYAFQNVPNTTMEPRAVADYLSQKVEKGKTITIATFAPDYSFGHDTVDGFIKALKDLGVDFKLVKQEFPPLGASNISSYLSALVAAKPDYVFNAQYGGDLVAFTKQAGSYGFFKDTKVIAMYAYAPLAALGDQAPAGAIGFDRAPFWAIDTPEMKDFVEQFKAEYGKYPTEWAIFAYAAAQQWAWGVEKAGSFEASKLIDVLPDAEPPTILGSLKIRGCDHQTTVPEYVGTISGTGDPQYDGLHLYEEPVFVAPFDDIALTCDEVAAMQP